MKERHVLLQGIIKESGLSQEEFGARLGMTKARINHYCHGRRKISGELISSLMQIFNINPSFFFEDTAPMYLDINLKADISARQQKTINRYMLVKNQEIIDDFIDIVFSNEGHKSESPVHDTISKIYKTNTTDSEGRQVL